MFIQSSLSDRSTFFQKLRSLDYIMLLCILILGIISSFAMYATDGGELLYHSESHIIRFVVFFAMMILISFVNIKTWHTFGYLFYLVVLTLLIWASLFGITASGSQRWINLYFINLQPSELMKIAIIICDHAARDILAVADSSIILSNGKIIAQGTPSELMNNVSARIHYFGESFKFN